MRINPLTKGDEIMIIGQTRPAGLEKLCFHSASEGLINTDSDKDVSSLLEEYLFEGFSLVRLHGKAPFENDWPNKPSITIEEAEEHLESGGNIGVRTGDPSRGVYGLDVDHGWEEFARNNAELLKVVRWIKTSGDRGRVLVRGEGWKTVKKNIHGEKFWAMAINLFCLPHSIRTLIPPIAGLVILLSRLS